MSAVAAYIDCNPCEGGICKWPTEYKWCGWTAATEGDEHCRAMYRFIYGATVEDENDWSAIVKRHEEAIRKRLGEIVTYSLRHIHWGLTLLDPSVRPDARWTLPVGAAANFFRVRQGE